jgi:hypothetical protein
VSSQRTAVGLFSYSPLSFPYSSASYLHFLATPHAGNVWSDPAFAAKNKKNISVRPEKRSKEDDMPGIMQSVGDGLYRCGDALLQRLPDRAHDFFEKACPEAISNVDGGVEKTFCLMALLQVSLVVAFITTFAQNIESCLSATYLSLDGFGNDLCDHVKVQISDSYYLDDTGFWSSYKEWAFATTMLEVEFRQYLHSEDEWQTGISANVFDTYYTWNQEMKNKGQAANLAKLVTSYRPVRTSSKMKHAIGHSLNVMTKADPTSLMDTTYQYVYGARLNTGTKTSELGLDEERTAGRILVV